MWDKIKKAINSNLSKPLDTFMTEQFNSWATQRNRLDVAISTRATNDGVWTATGRTLSKSIPSSSLKLDVPTAREGIDKTYSYKTSLPTAGSLRINIDIKSYSSNSNSSLEIYTNGVLCGTYSLGSTTSTYKTVSLDVYNIGAGAVEFKFSLTSPTSSNYLYVKNFKVFYDFDNSNIIRFEQLS